MTSKSLRWGALLLALPLGVLVGSWLWAPADEQQPQAARPDPAQTAATRPDASPRPLPATSAPVAAPTVATADTPPPVEPRNVVVSEYHPRPPEEWQGMLVNLALQATCETSGGCGFAMACREGRCGPCTADGDCDAGEVCVLDHCVPSAQAGCRRKADCRADELCVLNGYSSDPRNNAGLRSFCLAGTGGETEEPSP